MSFLILIIGISLIYKGFINEGALVCIFALLMELIKHK